MLTLVLNNLVWLVLVTSPPPDGQSGTPAKPPPPSSGVAESRIVKRFDFDERDEGNNDRTPMNWSRVDGPGLPRYLEAVLDGAVGHDAAPSYRFSLQGGSLATQYYARDIPVRSGAIYQIVAFVRPARIVHSGAVITATYCDRELRPIESTARRCEPVRGASPNEPWKCVSFALPPAPAHAAFITLSCELRQATPRPPSRESPRPIHLVDATAEAWFDDISIIRLPLVTLDMVTPGVTAACNVFAGAEPIHASAVVRDMHGDSLSAQLEILDDTGEVRFAQAVDITSMDAHIEPKPIDLPVLAAGPHLARLTARSGDETLVAMERRFIRLGDAAPRAPGQTMPIGVCLTPAALRDLPASARILNCIGPGLVKVPVWRSEIDDGRLVYGDSAFNRFLDGLIARGATPIAVLESPPKSLAVTYDPGADGLMDVLSSPPHKWRPYLALPLARLGARVRHWQLGPDADSAGSEIADQVRLAVEQVSAELRPLVNQPVVIIPTGSASRLSAPRLAAASQPVELDGGETIALSDAIPWQRIGEEIGKVSRTSGNPHWGLVERLNAERLDRDARLTEFARRIVASLATGLDGVFVRQPWREQADGILPLDELGITHTFATALSGCTKATPVWIGADVAAWWFHGEEPRRGVLIAWTIGDSAEPRRVAMDVGEGVRRVDIWGNRVSQGSGEIEVSASPAIFENAVGWRVLAQASLTLDNPRITPELAPQGRVISLSNPMPARFRGRLRIATPVGLQVSPRMADVDIPAGQTFTMPVEMLAPTNFPAGEYTLALELRIDGEASAAVTLRTPLTVEAPGLDVQVLAEAEQDRVRIVQRITNRTDRSLVLRSILVAPGRPRTSRTIPDLPPGQTAIRTYFVEKRVPDGWRNSGLARVGVEEFGGGLVHNAIVPLE